MKQKPAIWLMQIIGIDYCFNKKYWGFVATIVNMLGFKSRYIYKENEEQWIMNHNSDLIVLEMGTSIVEAASTFW